MAAARKRLTLGVREMPTDVISIIIAFVGVCIAFVGFLANARNDSAKAEGRMGEIVTKLDFIGDDLKDLKASYRSVTSELQAVRDIATRAQESASSAHKRLDRAGIDRHE